MKNKLLKNLVTTVVTLTLTICLSAQYDVPENYETVVAAINAIRTAEGVNEATINVAAGEYLEPMYNGQAGKEMKITIQGAGAGLTVLKGFEDGEVPFPGEIKGKRLFRVDRATDTGTEFIVKDLTIKNFGYGDANGGGVINVANADAVVKATFINVNFENCLARRGAIVQMRSSNSSITFDNCSFFNCTSFDRQDIAGLIHIDGGNLILTNSTFMSNIIDPRDVYEVDGVPALIDRDRKNGGIISLVTSSRGDVVAVLENNIFVNNKTISDSVNFVHPVISVKAGNEELNIEVSLFANVAIGNVHAAHTLGADLYYTESDKITFICEDNIMNSVIKAVVEGEETSYVPAVVDGIRINAGYTYAHPYIEFTMEDDLPKVMIDEFGIKYVEYTGDGGFDTSVKPIEQRMNIRIYSYGDNLFVEGLNRGESLEIYSITGSLIARKKATEDVIIMELPKGLYIVKAGPTARKVFMY